ncbi:hypothetical protein FRC02_002356 [Tulasnella sp. 418]|nr:hypothetical protein FRC02_002356 [Tulasnella sp. 418]
MSVIIEGDLEDSNGDSLSEVVEMWAWNPLECIQELLENPLFEDHLKYKPQRTFTSATRQCRVYDEMWNSDWWWETQEKLPLGATVIPVILASNKTALTNFSGNKIAYPLYLTIGNLAKPYWRQPSLRGTVLLGYLPVPSLACCSSKTRSAKNYEVFHRCMQKILELMKSAGRKGKPMLYADKKIWRGYPIVAAYVADQPEQCLVACCLQNCCPQCKVAADGRGHYAFHEPCQHATTLNLMKQHEELHSKASYSTLHEAGISFPVSHPTCFTKSIKVSSKTTLLDGVML